MRQIWGYSMDNKTDLIIGNMHQVYFVYKGL